MLNFTFYTKLLILFDKYSSSLKIQGYFQTYDDDDNLNFIKKNLIIL
jgi:hypothetical protein